MGGMATWAIFLKFSFYKMLCQVDKRWAGELRRDSWRREAVRLGWAPLCWQAEFLVLHGWSRSGLLVRVTCIRIWSERWHASLLMSRITMVFVEWNFFFLNICPFGKFVSLCWLAVGQYLGQSQEEIVRGALVASDSTDTLDTSMMTVGHVYWAFAVCQALWVSFHPHKQPMK